MITASLFKNVQDRHPMVADDISGFEELASFLITDVPEADPELKCDQPCVSPAAYRAGETRSKAAAMSWDWFAADIDNKLGNFSGSTIEDIIEVMNGWGSPWLIYSTASYRPDSECFRLMFPLDRTVEASEFDVVWHAFSRMLPMDAQTKDISRIFIMPRRWKGREYRVENSLTGEPICVDEVLRRYPFARPIQTVAASVQPSSQRSLGSTQNLVVPASLTAPFVPQKAVETAMMAQVGGRMYRFLVAVAFSALRKGYAIDAQDLAQIGCDLAMALGRDTSDIARDATRALAFAETSHHDCLVDRAAHLRSILLPKSLR